MTGNEYANRVARYLVRSFGSRGISVYREVMLGKTVIGKNRRVDALVVEESTRTALAIECKYQDSPGTVDEKISYALEDMAALGMAGCLVYAGHGFSEGILHMLAASPIAARCMPDESLAPSAETRELDVVVAMTFRWWDLLVTGKRPVEA